jgi:alanyl-tRNA synthetase
MDTATGEFHPLSLPFSETVIGVERMAMVSECKSSVYEIDSIWPLMELVNHSLPSSGIHSQQQEKSKRILVDHVRAIYYLVADGAPEPGKDGRQRIIRGLLRSILAQEILLGFQGPALVRDLLQKLSADGDCNASGTGITRQIENYLESERVKFSATLRVGEDRLRRLLKDNGHSLLSGQEIVALEKKAGMPLELIEQFLAQRNLWYSRQDYLEAFEHWHSQEVANSHA